MIGPTRVLVVDDDRRFRAALAETLVDLGYEPVETPGAQEALRELQQGRIDVVLLDLRMPELSGHDLLRRLERGVPVVAMSGSGTMNDMIALMRQGAVDFLHKPFDPQQVEVALRRALGDRATTPEPGLRAPAPTDPRVRPTRSSPRSLRPDEPPAGTSPCDRLDETLSAGEVELPAIAPIAGRIRKLLHDPTCSVEEVVAVLKRDPTITGCLLKLANSSFFRGQVPATGLRAACLRLGNRRALTVAHQILVRGLFDLEGDLQSVAEAMWRNAAVTAFVARELAVRAGLPDPEGVHLAAMLHNLGELVLLRAFGAIVGGGPCPPGALEKLAPKIERSHEDVGRRLMKAWAMPSNLVLLAGAHHRKPWRPEFKEDMTRRQLVLASWALACRAGHRYLPGEDPPDPAELLSELDLDPADLDEVLEEAERWLAEADGGGR